MTLPEAATATKSATSPTAPRRAGGLIVPPGGGRTLRTAAQQVTFKVTGEQSRVNAP
ncbi:hypothetical protein OV450_3547 [Actinobacteria bacterium OV450]|nr:hypothetical protein OV450_3547 [Actinobacteria bacterium OV450]